MRRFAPAALLAAALTLTACTHDDPAPNYSTVSPTPSAPSSTRSSSPTPMNTRPGETSPTPLAEASQDTAEGAQAFAAYYVRTIDWVFATANPSLLQPFYAPECTTCQSRLDFLSALFSDGSYVEGGRLSLLSGSLVTNDGRLGAEYAVNTVVSVSEGTAFSSSGSPTSTVSAAPRITLTTWQKFDSGKWLIVEERYG